jgi:nucleoside-diphosphate-sugar epimerase
MSTRQTVLVLGGTGRTGGRVLAQLLGRGVEVRALVRSAGKIPTDVAGDDKLELVEADLLSLGDDELQGLLQGCDALVSCLGHVISFRGIMGPPYDLVTRMTIRLCRAIEAVQPEKPIKFVLMSSVSVNRPGGADTRRGRFERAFVWLIRALIPPARDNQRAADFLVQRIGDDDPFVAWTAVRPDTLLDGDVSAYTSHEALVDTLFAPGNTNMANVAHFMCELVTQPQTWTAWKGKLPVIINTSPTKAT